MLNHGHQVEQEVASRSVSHYSGYAPAAYDATKVLSRNLELLPAGASYALLVRHAERPNFSVLNFRQDTEITEKGLADARTLGRHLRGQHLTGFYSSPVLRCLQTCKGIMQGSDLEHLGLTKRKRIGEPGSYIVNPFVVFTYFLTSDVSAVIKKFAARGRMSGFLPLKEGSVRILREILGDISRPDTRNLYVSHDAVLAPFISYFTGQKFGEHEWVDYLDGVFITMKDGEVSLIWNGRKYPIDRKYYS